MLSLALFGVGSIACAYAPNAGFFLAARLLLGVAGAGVTVMALSALTVLFTVSERPKAVGVFAASNFVALPLGPILGGWMLTHFWWGTLFLLNVPLVAIGLIFAGLLIPDSKSERRHRIDIVGICASVLGLIGVTAGLVQAGQHGWTNTGALSLIGLGLLLLVAFFFWERRLTNSSTGDPLIDVRLFALPSFTWGSVLSGVAGLGLIGVIFTMPQYFQGVQSDDPQQSGLRLLPLIGGLVLGAIPAARVARLIGSKSTVAAGFGIMALGYVLGATTAATSSDWFVGTWMAIVGLGSGLALSTATSAAVSQLSPEDSGIGSAVVQAIQKVGGPLGTTILGSVLAASYQSGLHLRGLPGTAVIAVRHSVFAGVTVAHQVQSSALLATVRSSFVTGMDLALVVSGAIAVVGCIVAVIVMPRTVTESVKELPFVSASG